MSWPRALRLLAPLALGAAALAGWEALVRLNDIPHYILPAPSLVAETLLRDRAILLPSLWIDIQSYDPVRMVGVDGTEYRLAEVQSFKGIRLPRYIEIDPPGPLRARLEVLGATQADAPAAAFQPEWLQGPVGPLGAEPGGGLEPAARPR